MRKFNSKYLLFAVPLIFLFKKNKKVSYNYGNSDNFNTWDKLTNKRISKLHPKIRQAVTSAVNDCFTHGYKVRVASGLRTFAEQQKLYKKRPKVTNAKPGSSYHNYGLAVDIYEIKNGKITEKNRNKIAAIFKKHGFTWGGDWRGFKDRPHFQMTFGHHWHNLLKLYNSGKTKNGYVII